MFQVLTNVQTGEAVSLQQYIENRHGDLRVGLRSITYTVGWYNIKAGETVSWRSESADLLLEIPAGLYSLKQREELLEDAISDVGTAVTLEVSPTNGLITLTVAEEWEVKLSDGLLALLGLDDGVGGAWLNTGVYTGDRPVDFAPRKELRVHLEQLCTTGNVVDGAPSTLLTFIGVGCHSFGDVHTVRIEHPKYKRLAEGSVSELKACVRDDSGA